MFYLNAYRIILNYLKLESVTTLNKKNDCILLCQNSVLLHISALLTTKFVYTNNNNQLVLL